MKKMENTLNEAFDGACRDFAQALPVYEVDAVRRNIEYRLARAYLTLVRLPDSEWAWLKNSDRACWPSYWSGYHDGDDIERTAFETLMKTSPSRQDISDMQPALDLLQLLPDPADRKLVAAVATWFLGEPTDRIYWEPVKARLEGRLAVASKWTLKRRYNSAMDTLTICVMALA